MTLWSKASSFGLGVVLGGAIGIVAIAAALGFEPGPVPLSIGEAEWEVLVSALAALIAAGVTVYFLDRQHRAEQKRAAEALARQRVARRAVLPHVLSQLQGYVEDCISYLCSAQSTINAGGTVGDPPSPPAAEVKQISDFLEVIEDRAVVASFAGLLSALQVHTARIGKLPRGPRSTTPGGAPSYRGASAYYMPISSSIILAAAINRYFSFARFETDVAPSGPTQEDVNRVLTLLYLPPNRATFASHSMLNQMITRILRALEGADEEVTTA